MPTTFINNNLTSGMTGAEFSTSVYRGQNFISVNQSFTLSQVRLLLDRDVGTPSDTARVIVSIHNTVGGNADPDMGTTLASGSLITSVLPQSEANQTFTLTSPLTITSGVNYAIVARLDAAAGVNVAWRTKGGGSTDHYVPGADVYAKVSSDSGGTWTGFGGSTLLDANFVLLGDEIIGAPVTEPDIRVDWNNDLTFSDTESISSDVMSVSWNIGKEPEEENTPAGTATIVINDPDGHYFPNSTFWDVSPGDNNVQTNRGVRAILDYQGISHGVFRGGINRITSNTNAGIADQTVTIFCVDEMEVFRKKRISIPNSPGLSSGGDAAQQPDNPLLSITIGATGNADSTGALFRILAETSFAVTRQNLSEAGTTCEAYWTIDNARAAIEELERHEGKRSMIFISSCGDFTFHSSTHRNGSVVTTTFGTSGGHIGFQNLTYNFSADNVQNEATVRIFSRNTQSSAPQFIPVPGVSIPDGTTYIWTVDLDEAPVSEVTIPPSSSGNDTLGLRCLGGGTTFGGGGGFDKLVQGEVLGGGSQVRFSIKNDDVGIGVTFTVESPSTADGYTGPSNTFPLIVRKYAVSAVESISCDDVSIARYGRRAATLDLPFFGGIDGVSVTAQAQNRADAEIAHNSTAHGEDVKLKLEGSDSDAITTILSREMNDRVRINSTTIHRLSDVDFYITGGDYTLDAGGHLTATWNLLEAT